jgi:hypothetical protein
MNDYPYEVMNRILDGEAGAQDHAALTDWLRADPDHLRAWTRMEEVHHLFRQAPMTQPSAHFSTRVMAQVRREGQPQSQGELPLVLRMAIVALVGAAILLAIRILLPAVIGPLPELDDILALLDNVWASLGQAVDALLGLARTYPVLPALGAASIPLGFAVLWLAVYYTPTDRLRSSVTRRLR